MQTAGSGARLRRIRRSTARWLLIAAGALLLTVLAGSALVRLYTEALWFDALGHAGVLWTRIGAQLAVRVVAGAIAAALVLANLLFVTRHLGPVHLRRRYGNLEIAEQVPRLQVTIGVVLVAVLAGWWLSGVQFGAAPSLHVLAWLRSAPWGISDPVFDHDLGFYVFTLPLLTRFIGYLLLVLVWSVLLVALGYALLGAIRVRDTRVEVDEGARLHFALLLATAVLLFGVRFWLGRYDVLFGGSGFGGTIGYTDVHARLPARTIIALLAVGTAATVLYGAVRRNWTPAIAAAGVLFVTTLVGAVIYPSAVQKLRVEPNQLERERQYIDWLIAYTRRGFGLDAIEQRAWRPTRAGAALRAQSVPWIDRLPLWDATPLNTALSQQETRREYYDFHDVDFDRYRANGALRQVAIAVRERGALPPERQTWRNIHIEPTYTHGFGAVVTVASEAARGDPVFWLADLDPVERDPLAPAELELSEPRIYFGETMGEYVVLNPLPDSSGRVAPVDSVTSGIPLDSFLRVLAFSWRFGDKNLLFSSEHGADSRLLFRRPIVERVRALAPFLLWDSNAYPVVWHGRIVWIVDGYSATPEFPIAEPLELSEDAVVRYMRNSAKAVVDGVSGEVTLYAMDEAEPLLATYRRVFPGLVQPLRALPPELHAHLRYPANLAAAQADKLQRFHVQSADAFYSGQFEWQRPRQGPDQTAGSYAPIFTVAALPGSSRPEYLLSTPFIAAGRENMTGVLYVRNDPPHYGEAILLEVSGADVVRGPTQVLALIEQDAVISSQLSLWRQGGSDVELGQIRVVPLDSTAIYVVPLYLSAGGSGLPQLQQVIVSDGASVSMAPSLTTAIERLGHERTGEPSAPAPSGPTISAGPWAAEALRLQQAANRALREGDWATFGERWNELQILLRSAAAQSPGTP